MAVRDPDVINEDPGSCTAGCDKKASNGQDRGVNLSIENHSQCGIASSSACESVVSESFMVVNGACGYHSDIQTRKFPDEEVWAGRGRLMSEPIQASRTPSANIESGDEAYGSEFSSDMSIASSSPENRKHHPGFQRQRSGGRQLSRLSAGRSAISHKGGPNVHQTVILPSEESEDGIKHDNHNIHGELPLNGVDNENFIRCHCSACCSCRGNSSGKGCAHHQTCERKLSGENGENADQSECNLPSPTSISSWGHFCKSKGNHYKYRRSDYSSDSDDDLPLKRRVKPIPDGSNTSSQRSHLPNPSLVGHTSSASSRAAKKDSGNVKETPKSECPSPTGKDGLKPRDFKDKITTIMKWFSDFSDEQKNILLKEILNGCDLPQIHLLSVKMEANLHQGCPPNCQDIITWLPSNQATRIMAYLDPVSLCRAGQVCKAWYQLANEPSFWRRFCCQQKWRLSKAAEHKQVISHMSPEGCIQWKKVFAERFRLRNNWLRGRCTVRTFEGHSQGISCVQFDDSRIVSGSSDKTIKVWNIRTNAQWSVQTLVGHSGTVRCLHLEGNRLVSGSTDKMIKVWDLSTQESWSSIACKVTMVGHTDTVRCLQVDDDKVISGSYDKMLKVWDLQTGNCRMTLRGHEAAVLCVHFSETKIVSGSCDKTIKVWKYTGECIRTLTGHQDAVTCLQFDSTRIVSGSLDCNLKFWDMHTGECINTIDWKAAEGHTGVVRCLQADSWRLVSAADDKTIKVWNLETGKRLVTLRNHTDGVTCLQFNDFIIVSGSYDKTVKLWDFSCC